MSRIFETQDGSHSIFSEKFGVSYHSKYGAIQETEHVFINAALNYKALDHKKLSILEIGFGSGLNALMTYLEAEKQKLDINFTTIEAFPISKEEVETLNYTQLLDCSPDIFLKIHDDNWNKNSVISDFFSLKKLQLRFEEIQFEEEFDIIYFDAFAPNSQPELWEADLMQKMYNALKEAGVLVTYCAKGAVKRTLKSVGFEVESLKGPPGKREMTRAIKRLGNK